MNKIQKLFLSIFIVTFVITILISFYGLWLSWEYGKEIPYLSSLLSVSVLEVAVCITWLFRKIFSSSKHVLKQTIQHSLRLTKSIFLKFLNKDEDIRLSLLSVDDTKSKLTMFVQDSEFTDKDFSIQIDEGIEKQIVVCKVAKQKSFMCETLTTNHFLKYLDSPIPKKLAAVMATPVKNENGQIIAVLSLDSTKDFNLFNSIKEDDIKEVLLSLRTLIQDILSEHKITKLG